MIKRKKIFLIATFIIIAALVIVLYVGLFCEGRKKEFDGTLVKINMEECCT